MSVVYIYLKTINLAVYCSKNIELNDHFFSLKKGEIKFLENKRALSESTE